MKNAFMMNARCLSVACARGVTAWRGGATKELSSRGASSMRTHRVRSDRGRPPAGAAMPHDSVRSPRHRGSIMTPPLGPDPNPSLVLPVHHGPLDDPAGGGDVPGSAGGAGASCDGHRPSPPRRARTQGDGDRGSDNPRGRIGREAGDGSNVQRGQREIGGPASRPSVRGAHSHGTRRAWRARPVLAPETANCRLGKHRRGGRWEVCAVPRSPRLESP